LAKQQIALICAPKIRHEFATKVIQRVGRNVGNWWWPPPQPRSAFPVP